MNYNDRLQKLHASALVHRQRSTELKGATRITSRHLIKLLIAMRGALLWSAVMQLLRLFEILVLATWHYVYFPPVSLTSLRIISALSFLPMIAAFSLKILELPKGPSGLPIVALEHAVRRIARALVLGGVVVGLGILSWITFETQINLASPPIFRAIIAASILCLPLEILTVFLLSFKSVFPAPKARARSRMLALGCYVAALGCVVADLPVLYIVLTVCPRFLYARQLWCDATANSNVSLFQLSRPRTPEECTFDLLLVRRIAPLLTLLVAHELAFFLLFARVASSDTSRSMIIFLAHKLSHFAAILAARTTISLARHRRRAMRIGGVAMARLLNQRAVAGWAIALGGAVFLLPIIFSQREALFWVSPTGRAPSLSSFLMTLLLVQIATRSWASVKIFSFGHGALRKRDMCPLLVLLVALPLLAFLSFHLLERTFATDSIFLTLMAFDICSNVIIALRPNPPVEAPESTRTTRFLPFLSFLEICNQNVQTQNRLFELGYLSIGKEVSAEAFRLLGVWGAFSEMHCTWWGKCTTFVLIPTEQRLSFECAILTEAGFAIEDMKFVPVGPPQDVTALFQRLIPSHLGLEELLYRVGCRAFLGAASSGVPAGGGEAALWDAAEVAFEKSEGWSPTSFCDNEISESSHKFIEEILIHLDCMDPVIWLKRHARGFVHLNKNGAPKTILKIKEEKYSQLQELRLLAFKLNLDDALRSLSRAELRQKAQPPLSAGVAP